MIPLPMLSLRHAAIAAGVLAVLFALWRWGESREADGRAAVRAEWDAQRAAQERAAAQAAAEYRQIERQLAHAQQEALHARETERSEARRVAADLRADHDRRLRDAITSYASGGGLAAPDSTAACRGRAAQLGAALDDALQAHGECTAAAVDLAADLRAVLAAWPVAAQADPGQAPTTTERTDHVPDL